MSFDIKHNGVSIKDKLITLDYQKQICSGVGSLSASFTNHTFNPYDVLTVYEDGRLAATFYVASTEYDFGTGTVNVVAQDGSKKLVDFYFSDTTYYTTPTTCRYWINKILDEALVNYEYLTQSYGNIIPPNTPVGPGNGMELVTSLLQQSGWYITFSENNTAKIGKITLDEQPKLVLNDFKILNVTVTKDSEMLRNRAIVYGAVDPRTMQTVTGKAEKWTGFEMTSADWRTTVVASPYIYYKEDADYIANLLVKEFAKLTEVKVVDIAGFVDCGIGDTVEINSDYWSGVGLVTTKRVSVSSNGFITTLYIDERCPRLFVYFGSKFVYLGTDGAGVWKKPISYPNASWINFSSGISESDLVIRDLSIYRGVFACIGGNNIYQRTSSTAWKPLQKPSQTFIPTGCKVNENVIYVIGTDTRDEKSYLVTYNRFGKLLNTEEVLISGYGGELISYDVDSIDSRPLISSRLKTAYFEPNTEDNTLKGITGVALDNPIGYFDGYYWTYILSYPNKLTIYAISENSSYSYEFYNVDFSSLPSSAFRKRGNIIDFCTIDIRLDSPKRMVFSVYSFDLLNLTYTTSQTTIHTLGDVIFINNQPVYGVTSSRNKILFGFVLIPDYYDQARKLVCVAYNLETDTYNTYEFPGYRSFLRLFSYNDKKYLVFEKSDFGETYDYSLQLLIVHVSKDGVVFNTTDEKFVVVQFYHVDYGCIRYLFPFSDVYFIKNLFSEPIIEVYYPIYINFRDLGIGCDRVEYYERFYIDVYGNVVSGAAKTLSDYGIDLDQDGFGGTLYLYLETLVNGNQLWYIKRKDYKLYLLAMNIYSKQIVAVVQLANYFYSYQSERSFLPPFDENPDDPFKYPGFLTVHNNSASEALIPLTTLINYVLTVSKTIIDDHHLPFVIEVKNNKILELPTGLSGYFLPTLYKSVSGLFPDDIRYSTASGYPTGLGFPSSGFAELNNYGDLNVVGAAINLTDAKFYSLDLNNLTPAASGFIYIVANGKLATVDIPEKRFVSLEPLPPGFYPYKVELLPYETGVFVAGSGEFYEKTVYTNGLYAPASGNLPQAMPTVLRVDDAI